MPANNDIPRGFKFIPVFWPIALAFAGMGASMVRADVQIDQVEMRVDDITRNGSPVVRERLARMEEKQDAMTQTLLRMEHKLDDLDKRTREANLRGL